jgi:hypothetical protein
MQTQKKPADSNDLKLGAWEQIPAQLYLQRRYHLQVTGRNSSSEQLLGITLLFQRSHDGGAGGLGDLVLNHNKGEPKTAILTEAYCGKYSQDEVKAAHLQHRQLILKKQIISH